MPNVKKVKRCFSAKKEKHLTAIVDDVHGFLRRYTNYWMHSVYDSRFFGERKLCRPLKIKTVTAILYLKIFVRSAGFYYKNILKFFEYSRAKGAKYFPRGEFYDYGQNRAYFNHYRRTQLGKHRPFPLWHRCMDIRRTGCYAQPYCLYPCGPCGNMVHFSAFPRAWQPPCRRLYLIPARSKSRSTKKVKHPFKAGTVTVKGKGKRPRIPDLKGLGKQGVLSAAFAAT